MSTNQELAVLRHAGAIATGDVSAIRAIYLNAKTLSPTKRWQSVLTEIQQFLTEIQQIKDPGNVNASATLETIVSDQSAILPLREAAAISLDKMHASTQ